MQVRPLGSTLGTEITGIDCTRPLDEAVVAAIRRLWLERIVLCFPGAHLGPEQLMRFTARFGTVDDNRTIPDLPHPDSSKVLVITNKAHTLGTKTYRGLRVDHWHTDHSFTIHPASGSFLSAQELPEVGGDTMFANMYAAYEALSPAMQRTIDPLEGVHDVSLSPAFHDRTAAVQEEMLRKNPLVVHPVVRPHPETGRKALFLGDRLRKFAGMTDEETQPLLRFLLAHAVRYEFVYRHRWSPGDLVVWDNRCSMHYAIPDYDPKSLRCMYRCSLLPPKSGYYYEEDGPVRAIAPIAAPS